MFCTTVEVPLQPIWNQYQNPLPTSAARARTLNRADQQITPFGRQP